MPRKELQILSGRTGAWDLLGAVKDASGGEDPFDYINVPRVSLGVTLTLPEEEFKRVDPLAEDQMREICKSMFVEYCRTRLIPLLNLFDILYDEIEKLDEFHHTIIMQMRDVVEREVEEVKKECQKEMRKYLTEITHQRHKYGEYRGQVTKRAIQTTVALGTAVAATAGGVASGGATLALGLVSLYQAVMATAKLIRDCAVEAEECQRNVIKALHKLSTSYGVKQDGGKVSGAQKAGNTSKELAANFFLNTILKLPAIKNNLASVAQVKSEVELWENKLSNLRYQAHDLTETLTKYIGNQEMLVKDLGYCEKHGLDSEKKKHAKTLEKAEKNVKKILEEGMYIPSMGKSITITDLHLRAQSGTREVPKLKAVLDQLESHLSPGTLLASQALDVAVGVAMIIANYSYGATHLDDTFFGSAQFFGVTAPQDGYATVNSLYDLAISLGAKDVQKVWVRTLVAS